MHVRLTISCQADDLCRLLITYASNLDQDQNRRKKVDFEKKRADANKSMTNYPACKELKKGLMHVRLDDEHSNALLKLHSWPEPHLPYLVTHAKWQVCY